MSALEDVRRITERIVTASAKGDFAPFVSAMDDDLEVFDHVPYRFEDKGSFLEYLQSVMAGAESTTFAFHQPSCRVFNDDAAVVNAREAAQIFGGYGFMSETPVARFYRDAKILEIGEGTSEILRMVIARELGLTTRA